MHFNPQLFKVSIIQTKLFGPLEFELSRFHCKCSASITVYNLRTKLGCNVKNVSSDICADGRHKSVCACAQGDQSSLSA